MLKEIAVVGVVGSVIATIADHENLLGNNPQKQFWWERLFGPKVVTKIVYVPKPVTPMNEPVVKSKYTTSQSSPNEFSQKYPGAYQ